MENSLMILDSIIITFGIPFLIAIQTWQLKEHLSLRKDLKMVEIEFKEFKKLNEKEKKEILFKIEQLKEEK